MVAEVVDEPTTQQQDTGDQLPDPAGEVDGDRAGVEGGGDPSDAGAAPPGGHEQSWVGHHHDLRPPRLHLHALSNGLIVTLVVSGPVLLLEANWHNAPLTHQPDGAWVLALLAVAAAFFAGGALAGRHRRKVSGAVYQGLALAGLALGALLVGGAFRQLVLVEGFPTAMTDGWLVLAAALACVVAVGGSLFGRARYLRMKKRRTT